MTITPGRYLRQRREAAGLTRDDVALKIATDPAIGALCRADWLSQIEADAAVITADIATALRSAFPFDQQVLIHLVALHAGAPLQPPHLCRRCGCSWYDPCATDGRPCCSWSPDDVEICTECLIGDAEMRFATVLRGDRAHQAVSA